jgi:hypothetical protein
MELAPVKTFKPAQPVKRDYECTTVLACVAAENPDPSKWTLADESALSGLTRLHTQNGVTFYGYL